MSNGSLPLPTPDQIAARAYQLFLQRGRLHGHDMDDWLQAEYELMQLPVRKIVELAPLPPLPRKGRVTQSALVSAIQTAIILATSMSSPMHR